MADGAHGPGDVPVLRISDGGTVQGPDLPNWQGEFMLGICDDAMTWRGAEVRFLTIAPRYVGTTLADIRRSGGIVGVCRVIAQHDALLWQLVDTTALEYWGAGVLTPLEV